MLVMFGKRILEGDIATMVMSQSSVGGGVGIQDVDFIGLVIFRLAGLPRVEFIGPQIDKLFLFYYYGLVTHPQ